MDLAKFLNAQLAPRELAVDVQELQAFFPEGEPCTWTVRGLTAAELGRANEAADRNENLVALIEAMAGGGEGEKVDAIRKTMGISDKDVPADISRRIEMLTAGSVSPELGPDRRDVAVRLAETYPVTFYDLTNKIRELTGAGAEVGKQKPSGKTKK